jgi:hypothetical protein
MSGAQYDNPNQQVVRADQSGPAEEGTGGAQAEQSRAKSLDDMTKAELLDYAESHGVEGVSHEMVKADILAAVKAAGA